MSIWSKVFLGLTIVAAMAFWVLSARTLLAHRTWRTAAANLERSLTDARAEHERLVKGTGEGDGLRDLKADVHAALLWRGRMWRDCQVTAINRDTGAATVTIEQPVPHGIPAGIVVFAIDERPAAEGGGYVGAFRVAAAGENTVDLVPVYTPLPDDLERMAGHGGPWVLHEKMPADSRDVFAALDDDQRAALLPAGSRDQYAKDGQPADSADAGLPVVDGRFRRPLRDYEVLFREFDRQRIVRIDAIQSVEAAIRSLERSRQGVERQITFQEQENAGLESSLAAVTRERDAVIAHRDQLDAALAQTEGRIAELMAENRRLAAALETRQRQAVEAPPTGPLN